MMLKDLAAIQQQQLAAEENMSNLTSASGDQASVSSHPLPPPAKKKRSLPGNPDPDAEVIALSPRTLMATNRYVCEVCGKGFQRDQNLQLHRRGHNLPWKLKQRNPKEVVRKKVYVCPEAGCVHHDPARALGDLTGIKKHFSRKHGEKKWKCDRCAKRYAVHSDWKAHSKVCGTRERDSFITHRAFCDALAEESARAVTAAAAVAGQHAGMLFSQGAGGGEGGASGGLHLPSVLDPSQPLGGHGMSLQELCLKREQQQQQFAPSWLTAQQQQHLELQAAGAGNSAMFGSARPLDQEYMGSSTPESTAQPAGLGSGFSPSAAGTAASAHMSATALLQKAAQMGATLSRPSNQGQMASTHSTSTTSVATANAAAAAAGNVPSTGAGALGFGASHHFGPEERRTRTDRDAGNGGNAAGAARGGNDGLTRDFLGLRAFSHGDILSMAGFDPRMSSASSAAAYEQGHQSSKQWHV
ncbi:Protein indeterminate-domain 11 [Dichanthelium oligosanthes]|uniref:Protein indeterminate-domain 11 n=1 Tax=Dichanthelium oligosanthes TaxID=888268 RepID=A0A1E5WHT5_9POAL|nr:Protein indeterminate-domain 11 [Dichanthelium oligosanthes]